MPDPHPSTVLFPPTPSISTLLTTLKRANLTIHNRLTSIHADADFVARVAAAFQRPLVANERCGSWYVRPAEKAASAYFKSTDGHERAWKFSTRRLNLHLVDMIEAHDGIIVVDSTRRGKRMPDALSTTLPIWCTVLNLTLLPQNPLSQTLHLPPSLPPSTHSQVTALLPTFVASLKALNLPLPTLTKPLRPLWITPDSSLPENDSGIGIGGGGGGGGGGAEQGEEGDGAERDPGRPGIFDHYRPIICCTASRRLASSEISQGYIQGAGDDTENWALGLTPPLFWAHAHELLSAPDPDLPALISRLVAAAAAAAVASSSIEEEAPRHSLTPFLSVCSLPLQASDSIPTECRIAVLPARTPKEQWIKSSTCMQVGLGKGKTASRNLRLDLPDIIDFAAKFLSARSEADPPGQIVIACESGRDLSVGVALAISCYLFDEAGKFRIPEPNVSFTKTLVRGRLGPIMTVYPDASPSRTTLQSVNSFLMDWQR